MNNVSADFETLKTGVLIPTFNNAGSLGKVISGVAEYTQQIIVVNDGSTDETAGVLQQFPFITVINFAQNKGKGCALRKGFEVALQMGFQYLITIDSDGQHAPSDLPKFLDGIKTNPQALIIGARNMEQSSVPGKSSFGNKFSNFWFWVETGIKAPDTQSGYRIYPIAALQNISYFGTKFEFEVEVLVRAAWKGIKILSVPVSVYYAPADVRISHFRPFQDFSRISVLNTFLVIIAFFYIKPRNFFRTLFNREKLNKLINDHLLHPHHPDWLKALSIAFGVFMGIIPIWGFQMLAAISLAVLFRLNKPLVIVAANISIPPMIPFIVFGSYKMGEYVMGSEAVNLRFSSDITLHLIKTNWEQYLYGSTLLAILAGTLAGILSFSLLKIFSKKPQPGEVK